MSLALSRPRALLPVAALLLGMLLQLPLIANPGYFSHDELQWAARAIDGVHVDWADVGALQYRPLTFTLWLALSRALFAQPMLFHAAIALLGAANATLLGAVLRRAGVRPAVALGAAAAFVLSPYAMYVHGWVATLGDLLWCLCGLGIAWWVVGTGRGVVPVAAVLTLAALLAKESALSIPALAVVAVLLDAARRQRWVRAAAASMSVAGLYLLLRYRALSSVPDTDSYAWHLGNIPLRLLQFELYPLLPRVFEVHNSLSTPRTLELAVAGLALCVMLGLLARRGGRWLAGFVAGSVAALGPVLVLDNPATQYGYALAALTVGLFALAWARLHRVERRLLLAIALLVALHGAFVARMVLHVGRVQAVYSPASAAAVARAGRIRVAPVAPDDAWIFLRLSHQIPHYRGVPLMDRLQVAAPDEPADYRVAPDGRLQPAR